MTGENRLRETIAIFKQYRLELVQLDCLLRRGETVVQGFVRRDITVYMSHNKGALSYVFVQFRFYKGVIYCRISHHDNIILETMKFFVYRINLLRFR